MREETKLFLTFLDENECCPFGMRGRLGGVEEKTNTVVEYLQDLSKNKLIDIISDKYWNNYPSIKYWPARAKKMKIEERPFGQILSSVVYEIFMFHNDLWDLIRKRGEGIFLYRYLRYSSGKEKLLAARRGKNSKDNRARGIAVKSLPVSQIKPFKKDKSANIRMNVIKRLGPENCAKDFLNDKSRYIRSLAVLSSPIDSYDHKEYLNNFKMDLELGKRFYSFQREYQIVRKILSKISNEELIYYLDLVGHKGLKGIPYKYSLEKLFEIRMNN